MKRIVFAIVLIISLQAVAQTGTTPATTSNPKVRAITGFVRLDRATYRKQITDALVVLRRVKAEFESSGYEVQTVRLTTQPLAELVSGLPEEQALAFLAQLDELSVKEHFLPNVGPAMLHDSDNSVAPRRQRCAAIGALRNYRAGLHRVRLELFGIASIPFWAVPG
jgi:hypothetical protein